MNFGHGFQEHPTRTGRGARPPAGTSVKPDPGTMHDATCPSFCGQERAAGPIRDNTMLAAVVALAGPVSSLRSLRYPGEVRCPGWGAGRCEHLGDPAGQQAARRPSRGGQCGVAEPGRRGDSGRRHPRERLPLQGVSGDIPVPCRAGLPALGEAAPPQRGIAGHPTGTPEPDLSHFARRLASVAGGYEPPPGY